MEQDITSLDLSRPDITKLQNLGYNYNIELTQPILSSLQIDTLKTPQTKTALELLEEELTDGFILSYNKYLDRVLKDEVAPKRITELTGLPGTGKTQISFQLCITVQLPKLCGGLEGEAIYISTNNNLASHRIREMAEQFMKQVGTLGESIDDFSVESILKKIFVFKCDDVIDLLASVKYLENFLQGKKVITNKIWLLPTKPNHLFLTSATNMSETHVKKVKLIVIDSISTPLRELYQEERTNVLHKIFTDLQELSCIFNFAVVVTNDFTVRIKNNQTFYVPSFGDSCHHRVNSRIILSKNKSVHYAELVKSVLKPYMKIPFSIF